MAAFLSTSDLFKNVMKTMKEAGEIANISPNALERLKTPRRSIMVSIPVSMDDGNIKVFTGYRVQHNQTLGPFKGGLRYHETVNLSEVAGLATLMTMKTSLLQLPLGGAKGGVEVDPSKLSNHELEKLTRSFATELGPFIGPDKDIPAPDVGTDSQTMAWILDTYSSESGYAQTGVVTGKPVEIGGSLGRDSATGLGVVYTIEKALETRNENIKDVTIAIQGFGKVGLHAANEAFALGGKIVSVSDVEGAIYNPEGLNIRELIQFSHEKGSVIGFPGAKAITNDELLFLDVDVLAPCALDGVINSINVNNVRAKIIVEGANGPVTANASHILNSNGIMVVPDILANGGGVVVSYFEWVQDLDWHFWEEATVRGKLKSVMYKSFDKVWSFSKEHHKDMRTSAMAVALLRLEKALKLRGQAW
ncbi:MAG: Glu/Leu/Phe/Val dehydrogenase [Bdellovibrionaceae bacterium]|jgi:glutamate dehydrogenase (NAD(P)+)|nr:Glu/Leu/Phe/Val dehydrogenase [Pseudobdellovibrionaceae bacterium]